MPILAVLFLLLFLGGVLNTVTAHREMFWVCIRQDLAFGGFLTVIWLVLAAINTILEKLW